MKKMMRFVTAGVLMTATLFGGLASASAASYRLAPGDTLWKVSQWNGVSLSRLLAANPQIKNPNWVQVGQVINIPSKFTVDPYAPSGGAYPVIQKGDSIWIDVPLKQQRVRIMKGDKAIYTMVTSSGMEPDHATPRGTFYIEQERGTWFYSWKYQEGAQYWTSFKDHGVYLFHSVVMDKNQKVIDSEAQRLGQPASHGCLRMTVSDARWIYEHIPTGTKVVIHD